MSTKIARIIEQIKTKDRGKPRRKIAILGAGISGLVAAYELDKLGHEIVIYEANDRIGGRILTKYFSNNQYHELGAMRVPKLHDYVSYYVNEFKLDTREFIPQCREGKTFFYIRNTLSRYSQYYEKIVSKFNLSDDEKEIASEDVLALLNNAINPIIEEIKYNKADLDALMAVGSMTDRIRYLDNISLEDYLSSLLISDDVMTLIKSASGLGGIFDRALTAFIRIELALEYPHGEDSGFFEIVGGFDNLVLEFKKRIKGKDKMQCNSEIQIIQNLDSIIKLTVRNKDRGKYVIEYDQVICTIPFSTLRKIRLEGVSKAKKRSISNISYIPATKVLLYCRDRFWERKPYNIRGGNSQTDLMNMTIYYPSPLIYNQEIQSKYHDEQNINTKNEYKKESNEYIFKNENIPGVLVVTFWGMDAKKIDLLTKQEMVTKVINIISNIHPEINEKGMIIEHDSISWGNNPWSLGGFAFFKPGDFTEYYNDGIQPEGNLFFAGEHCSVDHAWIQGAINSSLRAVEQVVI